jgi:hypothetical protein
LTCEANQRPNAAFEEGAVKEDRKRDEEPYDGPKPTSPTDGVDPVLSFAKSIFNLHREGMQQEVQKRQTITRLDRNAYGQFM